MISLCWSSWVPCWGEVTCLLHFPRGRFVTQHLHPVLFLPTLSLPPTLLYKSLLTFMSSCFIVWSIDFSQDHLCDHRFRTGRESLMGSPFSTPLKKMMLLFTQGIYTTLLRLTNRHSNKAKRTSEQKRNTVFRTHPLQTISQQLRLYAQN